MSVEFHNLRVDPTWPFAPADGMAYSYEDRSRIMAMQPIRSASLPDNLLRSDPSSTLKPPMLVYGWRLGYKKLMAVARERFPEDIRMCYGRGDFEDADDDEDDTEEKDDEEEEDAMGGDSDEERSEEDGDEEDEGEEDEDEEDGDEEDEEDEDEEDDGMVESVIGTFWASPLISDICTAIGISEGDKTRRRLVNIIRMFDEHDKPKFGITCGNSYFGPILDEPHRSKLQEMFAPNEEPAWYLHEISWRWSRSLPPKPKIYYQFKGRPVVAARTASVQV